MAWTTEFSKDAERDFELIFDHLFESYIHLGEPADIAHERAARRVEEIRVLGESIAKAPHIGTLHDDIARGLRNVTIDRSIFWFDLDHEQATVRVLAVFFGGQNHIEHMLARLLA